MPDLLDCAAGAWTTHEDVGTPVKENLVVHELLDFRGALQYGPQGAMHKFKGLGTKRSGDRAATGWQVQKR